jgi:hypothetical protein
MPACTYALACMTMSLTTVTIVVIQLIASAVTIEACQHVFHAVLMLPLLVVLVLRWHS